MKSIERRFRKFQENHPLWSSYLCFAEATRDGGFQKPTLARWFNKLVEKDDYAGHEKKVVLAFLANLSNPLKTTENEGKTDPGTRFILPPAPEPSFANSNL